jgi:hypothetical protein
MVLLLQLHFQYIFALVILEMGFLELFGLAQTVILLISASQVARIAYMTY